MMMMKIITTITIIITSMFTVLSSHHGLCRSSSGSVDERGTMLCRRIIAADPADVAGRC